MFSFAARIILGCHLALAFVVGSSGMIFRLGAEAEESSEAKESSAALEASPCRHRMARLARHQPHMRLDFHTLTSTSRLRAPTRARAVHFAGGHTLPNGLNAPLLL
jgi:hypothetical protein